MITVQNLKYPFEHTIIYDVFDSLQVASLIKEAKNIAEKYDKDSSIQMLANDEHNHGVIEKYGTRVFVIDKVMPDGIIRNLCWNVPKLFFLNAIGKTNLTNYFQAVSSDKLYLQLYKNGDSYPNHPDSSTFSIVYIFYDSPNSAFEGGKFKFTDFNYEPYLLHNSCIIFPGWINHEVSEFKTNDNSTRISLSQFIFQAYNHTSITQTKEMIL